MSIGRWLAAVAIPVLVMAGAAAAAGEPGSSSSGSDGDVDAVIAVGAVALISGIIIYDILTDGPADRAETPGDAPALVPTGVDWSTVDPVAPGELSLVVASGGAPGGSRELLVLLADRAPGEYSVFPDVVDLGGVSGAAAFELASSFFDADIVVVVNTDGTIPGLEIIGRDGSIWSGSAGDVEGVLAALESAAVR